jgi:hypothetical protein
MPQVFEILVAEDITVISARTLFEKELPFDFGQWKIRAFLMTVEHMDLTALTIIIALGDN